MSPHFLIRSDARHGYTATAQAVPAHLTDWLLTHETFEPVPDTPGLYRLTDPHRDGERRARQAVHDLRRLGHRVDTDTVLAAPAPRAPARTAATEAAERRSRIAQAAARRSPTATPHPAAAPPSPTAPVPAADAAGLGRRR
ncbi:hypothetical protein F3K43_04925 [Streptomyces sp. LBUM 1476]|nr:hypothetical protein [Streptomyces sp. LBUM 1476]